MGRYSVHIETLGCRLNHDESEGAARSFVLNGFFVEQDTVSSQSETDENVILCIINTCTVTAKAEQKARRLIKLMLQKYPRSSLIVTGCYAQLDASSITEIDPDRIVILDGTKKFKLAQIASQMTPNGLLSVDKGLLNAKSLDEYIHSAPEELNQFSLFTPVFQKHSRASIKVQDGCNCSCAFCRIHLARGKSISLSADEVIKRIRNMEESGINEVVFTGVNLSQYRCKYADEKILDFADLLEKCLEESDKTAFRISSLYPQNVDERLCKVLSSPRIQPFFHLSIQSGSERILEAMNRPHSIEQVYGSIRLLRQIKDNPFISCDLIAGFPGETDEDFEETKKLCLENDFAWVHAFPFSPRKGTPAMEMKDQISEEVKKQRVKWLTDYAIKSKIKYVNSCRQKEYIAIVENSRLLRKNSECRNKIHAVTENMLHVECPLPDSLAEKIKSGSKITVLIEQCLFDSISNSQELDCTGSIKSF
ncbi:MAG: tRNA (N(6)-L-threonylcarbamoyladenosine(37)-C(2))-methylthiotransferase MtaB [Treponema sp.]|nr:tRNA (N(6)-L-threonylcarbamoyladenosine(37)-C(2))-methylthiotransferase MtaB [Treponema sp.]